VEPTSAHPNLAATSWALLGMLSYGHELSGYDIRKWIDWNMRFYYGSPAQSQIYSELKKLDRAGLVVSRVEDRGDTRSRRLYKITDAGVEAVTHWANVAPVDPPTLKHNVLLRVTLGHLSEPGRLKEVLQDHMAWVEKMHREAAKDARWSRVEPAWAYARMTLLWAERYLASERELTLKMIADLDEAQAVFAETGAAETGIPWPTPEYWYEIEQRASVEELD